MTTSPIRRVSVLSTGSVRIRPEHVGPTRQPDFLWLLVTARRWTPPRPINVYVIEHRDGLVLFDTGQDIASVTDPKYFPSGPAGYIFHRLARFDIAPEETLTAGLARLGYSLSDVDTAVLSHLHQDHIGGLPLLRGTRILLANAEWRAFDKPIPPLRGYIRSHIDLPGLRWDRISPEPLGDPTIAPFDAGHDIFGDGSLVLLPTPGHTAGSMSLLVRPEGKPLLMVGDLTYDADLLAAGHIPGIGDRRAMRTAVTMVNELRQRLPELTILPAHDPGAAQRLAGTGLTEGGH